MVIAALSLCHETAAPDRTARSPGWWAFTNGRGSARQIAAYRARLAGLADASVLL